MKRSVFLLTVFLILFAGFQESASAQPAGPPVNVIVRGELDDLQVDIQPWRVEMSQGEQLTVRIINTRRVVDRVEINNTGKPCGNASAFVRTANANRLVTELTADLTDYPADLWCKYNIVLKIGEEDITIDPDFRIR
jgi:hypothetical protein